MELEKSRNFWTLAAALLSVHVIYETMPCCYYMKSNSCSHTQYGPTRLILTYNKPRIMLDVVPDLYYSPPL